MDLVCSRCGTRQPPDALSFTCVKCGADLAEKKPQLESVDLGPSHDRADRRIVRSGWAPRGLQAAALIGAAGLLLYAIIRFLPELFVEETTVRRVMDDEVDAGMPVLRNELPPATSLGAIAVAPGREGWPVAGSGIVRGRVVWQRARSAPQIPFLVSDPACGATVVVPRFPVGELGGVNEALVTVIPGAVPAPPPEPLSHVLLASIRACQPSPRLLAGPGGTPVELRAVGGASHQLVSDVPLPGLPASLVQGGVVKTALPREGTAHLTDPTHPWERFTLVAVPTALASTVNAEGFFRIKDVPPGAATVRIYTEGTGPFDRRVQITPGGEVMMVIDVADETPGFGPATQP